jgi:radical SAM protein (TIGR01212 family)
LKKPAFWNNTKRYYDLKSYWRNRFGGQVYKLPIDAGFTCPNRDGSVAVGGCIYCDGRGSRLRQAGPLPSVSEQIAKGRDYYRKHRRAGQFIAYFQTFTNTYGPLDHLKRLYDEALAQEDVIGLSVGTRPDCVPDPVIRLLEGYAQKHHAWLEFGLQSMHDRTLNLINRGHSRAIFVDAVQRAAGKEYRFAPTSSSDCRVNRARKFLRLRGSSQRFPSRASKFTPCLSCGKPPWGNSTKTA